MYCGGPDYVIYFILSSEQTIKRRCNDWALMEKFKFSGEINIQKYVQISIMAF